LPERLFEVARHEVERADDPVAEGLRGQPGRAVAARPGWIRLSAQTWVDCPVASGCSALAESAIRLSA
jgi:hypothetical protein